MTTQTYAKTLSDSESIYMKGSKSVTKFSNTLSWVKGGLDGCKIKGKSSTYWMGTLPYRADSILHKNIIKVSKIGSVSISYGGGNVSVEGNNIIDEYYIENDWRINVDYNYRIYGILLNVAFNTAARVQFGSSFYAWSTAN